MRDKMPRRPLETRREAAVQFVGEQDGIPERDLKRALVAVLNRHPVSRAYLARVVFGADNSTGVALCLNGQEDAQLLAEIEESFARLFAEEQHLDIIFISEKQDAELSRVCNPFHQAA